ncbi:MAG: hypothetical protein LKJ86_04640, partial [Oscillibacter sp.]|nr:hypothetical protein [Oscillibacter sp.]
MLFQIGFACVPLSAVAFIAKNLYAGFLNYAPAKTPEVSSASALELSRPKIFWTVAPQTAHFPIRHIAFPDSGFAYFFAAIPQFFRYDRLKVTAYQHKAILVQIFDALLFKEVVYSGLVITDIPFIGCIAEGAADFDTRPLD